MGGEPLKQKEDDNEKDQIVWLQDRQLHSVWQLR